MSSFILTRRNLLKGAAGSALMLSSGILPIRRARADGLTIGIIYVGSRDDYGWNQAHAVAAAALKKVPDVTVVEEENVPETVAVAKTMESMIELDGAKLIFATSFGYYTPFVVDAAKKYPDVQFRHAAPLWTDKDPKNAGSYFGYLDQAHFIDGVAAGAQDFAVGNAQPAHTVEMDEAAVFRQRLAAAVEREAAERHSVGVLGREQRGTVRQHQPRRAAHAGEHGAGRQLEIAGAIDAG